MELVSGISGPNKKTVLEAPPMECLAAVAYRGGGIWGVQTPLEIPKFWQSWAEFPVPWKIHPLQPNKNMALTHFWVVAWKALPASYDPHSGIFFSLQGMTWRKHKVPKIKKILAYEMKFLVPNYSCLQNPSLGGYRPQIPVLSALCPQLNLLNPPPEKNSWVRHWQ